METFQKTAFKTSPASFPVNRSWLWTSVNELSCKLSTFATITLTIITKLIVNRPFFYRATITHRDNWIWTLPSGSQLVLTWKNIGIIMKSEGDKLFPFCPAMNNELICKSAFDPFFVPFPSTVFMLKWPPHERL